MNEIIKMLNKPLFIDNISLYNCSEKIYMQWTCCTQGKCYSILFRNVSRLYITDLSYPMHIDYLEIVCNIKKGWDVDSLYHFHEYENDRIQFYCQSFELCENIGPEA